MSTDDGRRKTRPGDTVDRAVERLERGRDGELDWGFGDDGTKEGEERRERRSDPEHAAGVRAGGGRADRLERLLLHQATAGERPYLERVPSGYAAENVVFDWLEFLVERAGYRATLEALRYYRSVGWLTERAEDQLGEYLRGFDDPSGSEPLTVEDHEQSLVYVAQLASLA